MLVRDRDKGVFDIKHMLVTVLVYNLNLRWLFFLKKGHTTPFFFLIGLFRISGASG